MDQHLSIEKTGIQGLYVVNPASYKSDEDLIVETYNSQELLNPPRVHPGGHLRHRHRV